MPTLSKGCEFIINDRLINHCTEINIISDTQAAYLKGYSTISQLVYIVYYIRTCCGKSNIVQGALLFIIYINDIVHDIESEIMIFADDTTLLASGSDPAETSAQLNRDLNKISSWAENWKVTFNATKSKDMIFSKIK